jgi:hypothetical protein
VAELVENYRNNPRGVFSAETTTMNHTALDRHLETKVG